MNPNDVALTPRNRLRLLDALGYVADVLEMEANIIADTGTDITPAETAMFGSLHNITYDMPHQWRLQLALAAVALEGDMKAGDDPRPRCVGEEAVLQIAIIEAANSTPYENLAKQLSKLPECPSDNDWWEVRDDLFEDQDYISVFFRSNVQGMWDPEDETNIALGIGDYRPESWFNWTFGGFSERVAA